MKNVRKVEMLQNKMDGFIISTTIGLQAVSGVFADSTITDSDDIFTATSKGFQDVYKQLLEISTPVAAVIIGGALLISHFGGEKAVEKGRKTALGAALTWLVINGIGFALTYVKNLIGTHGQINFAS